MHDYDNNSKLDGLEIFQGLSHHEHSDDEGEYPPMRWLMCRVSALLHLVLNFRSHIVVQGISLGCVTFYMYFILSFHIIRKKYLWRKHNRKCLRKEYTSFLWKFSNDKTFSYLLIHFLKKI